MTLCLSLTNARSGSPGRAALLRTAMHRLTFCVYELDLSLSERHSPLAGLGARPKGRMGLNLLSIKCAVWKRKQASSQINQRDRMQVLKRRKENSKWMLKKKKKKNPLQVRCCGARTPREGWAGAPGSVSRGGRGAQGSWYRLGCRAACARPPPSHVRVLPCLSPPPVLLENPVLGELRG